MKSRFYYEDHHKKVASAIKEYLNAHEDFLSPHTAGSPKATGEAIESVIADKFDTFLGPWCKKYSNDFSRRAMEDLAFIDTDNVYSAIDVKTHRETAHFSMPNLISVERLSRFYESDAHVFSLILVRYSIAKTKVRVSEVLFSPIEFLDWECLTVGALGWGQIQIKNANDIRIRDRHSRKRWMLQFCDVMDEFYPKEISKIQERIERFDTIRQYWEAKEDVCS